MNILVVSDVPTHQTTSGNRACILSYTEFLKNELGYNVHFLYIKNTYKRRDDENDLEITKKYWGNSLHVYKPPVYSYYRRVIMKRINSYINNGHVNVDDNYPDGLGKEIYKLNELYNFKAIIVNYIWLSKALVKLKNVKKIIYTHDVFSYSFKDFFYTTTPTQEAKALDRADVILSIQDNETSFFRYLTKKKVISVYSPIYFNDLPLALNKNILFFSGYNKYNIEGINYFIDKIFPDIIKKFKGIKLLIGGGICDYLSETNNEFNNNIELLGRFEDIKEFYNKGDIVINPVFNGSGLKIKSLEAISYGKTLISHPHSVEGIYCSNLHPALIAKSPSDYIKHLSILFDNNELLSQNKELAREYLFKYSLTIKNNFLEALN
ncbi:glycosyltransferase [Larkinella arboricola]